ncbi:MAG: hypothetical protein M0Z58_02645 [Nitrospiraceae bacterium]|nr:hypothetical protein [Nitrospiraceae bacterium]
MQAIDTVALKNIYRVNLGVTRRERVLVFTDKVSGKEGRLSPGELERRTGLPGIARAAAAAGRGLAKEVIYKEYAAAGGPAIEPPKALWAAAFGRKCTAALLSAGLLDRILKKKISEDDIGRAGQIVKKHAKDAVDAVIALSNYSTTHTIFRKLLTGAGARYASMPLFDAGMLDGPMNVDYKELKKLTLAVAKAIKGAGWIEITSKNGTKILFEKGRRRARQDNGDYRKPGAAGNLPAGEVYFAPIEGTARGRLVLEWAPTRKLKSPVTLIVKNGLVTEVQGREPFAEELRKRLASCPLCANIAELGIGTNAMAGRPDNILESEKILGTVHVALGDNHGFGGRVRAPFHQDFVFFSPTLTAIDGGKKTVIIRRGKNLV